MTAPRIAAAKLPLFAGLPDDDLLAYGVPLAWLSDLRRTDEDSLLSLVDRLPREAAEALLELATGGTPRVRLSAAATAIIFRCSKFGQSEPTRNT
jgi:hypothetical protein